MKFKKNSRNSFKKRNRKVRKVNKRENQSFKEISRLSNLRLNAIVATTFDGWQTRPTCTW